jgi:hypothetical protein
MTTNTNSDAFTRLLDDLLWLHARGSEANDRLQGAVDAMIAEYTANGDRYSDGSLTGEEYDPVWDDPDDPNLYRLGSQFRPCLPPHRRTVASSHRRIVASRSTVTRSGRGLIPECTSFISAAADPAAGNRKKETPAMTTTFDKHINVVDALTELIIQQGAIKFGEPADYLETLGVNTAGDKELTGEHVNQPHVRAGTTLLCAVSTEYVEVVEALFKTRPVMLEIGDPASFRSHEEPWWVAWVGHPAALT